MNRTINEAREGHDPSRALVSERLLRYSLEVRIVTASGMQVVDESLRALNKNMDVKQSRSPFLSVEESHGKKRMRLRLERQSHPFEYDLGMSLYRAGRNAPSLRRFTVEARRGSVK